MTLDINKLMTGKQKIIIKSALVGSVGLNLLMCLNLYHQVGRLEYKTYQISSDLNNAVGSLSRDVWEMKSSQYSDSSNYSGRF